MADGRHVDTLGPEVLERPRAVRDGRADGSSLCPGERREVGAVPAWSDKEMAEIDAAAPRREVESDHVLVLEQVPARDFYLSGLFLADKARLPWGLGCLAHIEILSVLTQ